MRIDEIDNKHSKFKETILDHNLTEEQLDEILPVIGAIGGGIARGAMAAGGVVARGAMAAGRGVASAAGRVGRSINNFAANQAEKQLQKTAQKQLQKKATNVATNITKSFKTDTANKLANQGKIKSTQGTQGTVGSNTSQTPQAALKRGQELEIPQPDPKNPKRTVPTRVKVKNVSGRDVEFQMKKKQAGLPNSIKFDKKDLAF